MVVPKPYSFDERVATANVGGELHLRVLRIVLADKASNKPDNDHLPTGGPGRREIDPRDRDLRGAWCGENRGCQDQSQHSKFPMLKVLSSRFSPGLPG